MIKEEIDVLLDIPIDQNGVTVRNSLATQFISWALKKIDGLKTYDSDVQAITALSSSFPGRLMADEKKIEIVLKLKKLGVL